MNYALAESHFRNFTYTSCTANQAIHVQSTFCSFAGKLVQQIMYLLFCNGLGCLIVRFRGKQTLQVAGATSATSAGAEFLNDKRKTKIKSVVDHYVSQRQHEQSAAAK